MLFINPRPEGYGGKQMMREAASLVSLLYVLAIRANIKWWYNVIVLCSVTASHRLLYAIVQCLLSNAILVHCAFTSDWGEPHGDRKAFPTTYKLSINLCMLSYVIRALIHWTV